ncbi:hypothetical protein TWF718_005159 [Orbilia javanica]|uniref:Uncharacterized protein n=1 Tax=Orbilia javanica TaxID=47235 RepID=A0AAN8N9D6_9PEZI
MPHLKHILLLFHSFAFLVLCEDLTEVVPTLTTFGSLAPFTPPADCFSRSVWSTSRFYDTGNSAGTLASRFFTRWYIGCNIDKNTGEYNSCCPPEYQTWGFYAPGVCPAGYTTLLTNAINPWIGDQRGTVCCPDFKLPSGKTLGGAAFATSSNIIFNPLAPRDPVSISCFQWDDDTSTSGTIFQANYNARAIIVFGEEITGLGTFQFLPITDEGTTSESRRSTPAVSTSSPRTTSSESESSSSTSEDTVTTTPSPGPITSPGPRQTDSSSSPSSSSESPTDTSQSNLNSEGGGKRQLSGGAIAGIAIGVAIPVIAGIAFLAYKMGRGRQDVPIVPIYNDPENKEAGYGGTQDPGPWR